MPNTYETVFICPGDLTQEKIDNTVEKVKTVITKATGKIGNAELWGRRKLAYPIKRQRDGFYVYMVFTAPPETMSQLDHHYRVTDTIIRGLTVKVDPRNLEKLRPVAVAAPAGTEASASSAPAPIAAEAPAAGSAEK